MRTSAVIENISKAIPDIYTKYSGFCVKVKTYSYGSVQHRITDDEALKLNIGQRIWVDAGWNDDGDGCYINLIRPILVIE
jgi:hypothetical protein